MRSRFSLVALAVGLCFGLSAQAHGIHVDHDSCGFGTDYDVRVNAAGIAFDRDDGKPAHVFMHDGALRIDGHAVAVSAADTERLRAYEAQVRALLPEVAGIAREGVDIGFDAMSTVIATFADTDRGRLVEKLNRQHRQALAQLDRGLGAGVWKRHDMDDLIEQSIGGTVSELVGTVTATAVKAALSGDEAQVEALEARADSLDRAIDRQVDARADKLDARAEALCPRLAALDRLQQQFEFRLDGGARLQLMEHEASHPDKPDRKDSDVADR
jgi:hypothetical protein